MSQAAGRDAPSALNMRTPGAMRCSRASRRFQAAPLEECLGARDAVRVTLEIILHSRVIPCVTTTSCGGV